MIMTSRNGGPYFLLNETIQLTLKQLLLIFGNEKIINFGEEIRNFIVFVFSQYDGGNIDKEQWLRFLPKPNEAKLNIMG